MTKTTRITDELINNNDAVVELIWNQTHCFGMVISRQGRDELYREQSSDRAELERWYLAEVKALTKALAF